MKKKWPLFILIPLLLMLISILVLYIWKSPRKIKDEYIGTEYSFQNLQFNMVSNDFVANHEGYEALVERGEENVITYDGPNGNTMIIIKNESTDFFNEIITPIQNPINLIRLERELLTTINTETGYGFDNYSIKIWEGDDKEAVFSEWVSTESTRQHITLDILLSNQFYTVTLAGAGLEDDAYEIIRTANLK